MQAAVRLIDHLLRLQGGIFEFSQAPDIILRLQFLTAPHAVTLGKISISRGEPVLGLHTWNERLPKLSSAGADLQWAICLRRGFICSLGEIAKLVRTDQRYANICAIYGASAMLSTTAHTGGLRMLQRLGFTILPYYRPMGRFGEFWENLFSWWMMWAYNQPSLHSRRFWRLQRTEIWMTRADFLRRFCR
jgi:hypothetical protein